MSQMKDFDPESFTLQKYVEKLAQLDPRTGLGPLSKSKVKPFDAKVLLESFEDSAHVLQELADKNKRRVDKLGHVCLKQEKEHAARLSELEGLYAEAFSEFQVLEERITSVSTKVVHLGDQLEASNNRRMRAVEAQDLMYHLKQFEKPKPALEIFTDPGRKLDAADLIFKLQTLSSELPTGEAKYKEMKENITAKYAEIESHLVDAFIDAQRSLDTKRMRQYAQALSPFPLGSQNVIKNYIHHNIPLQNFSSTDEMFTHIEDRLSKKIYDQVKEVFDNPAVVMTKYIHALVDKVIQKRVDNELRNLVTKLADKEKYLANLYSLYRKAMRFQEHVVKMNLGIDPTFLSKLIRVTLFSKYLSTYSEIEIEHLRTRSANALLEFQDMVGIARKPGTKVMVPASLSQNPDETFVSQEVCTSILHEAKGSVKRVKDLLSDRELSENVKDIYFTVLEKLCAEHFHTALDIALAVDLKSAPVGYFCTTVGNVNTNMHLIEKLFRETIMPCILYPAIATSCVERKRDVASKLERKIETGIEKSITQMVASVKQQLSTHQKKHDYRPDVPLVEGTQACSQAVGYISKCCQVMRLSLDGKNLEIVLMELGVRLHRVLYEHIQQFIINELGAMVIICDMNDYRRVMKDFKNSFLDELFENLQTLCNIFVVKAENLAQVCSEEPYANFDRSVLQVMIQLRSDYKTAKLQKLIF